MDKRAVREYSVTTESKEGDFQSILKLLLWGKKPKTLWELRIKLVYSTNNIICERGKMLMGKMISF